MATELSAFPHRIVSLVPSQTELLFELGLGDRVVGITKFCVHPDQWYRNKSRVGGTKTVSHKMIDELQPDLILANKEENTEADVQRLRENYTVMVTEVNTLTEALHMIGAVGGLCGKDQIANAMVGQISDSFALLKTNDIRSFRCAYLIWHNPIMVAAGNTFINDMMQQCGMVNVFAERIDSRYPIVEMKELATANADFIFLSSEPFHFTDAQAMAISRMCDGAHVLRVDGEMFSWYGSRMRMAPAYFAELTHAMKEIKSVL